MKRYLSFFLSLLIAIVYTILLLFSFNGFARNSLLEKLITDLHISQVGFFLAIVLIVCALVNIFVMIF
ncbi:hypothetical protein PT300_10515 [Enterobacteriaceae bacterium ESL0689]|nr:hypothetical protein [Enterobacteriaceae bacterium ESL0689]